MNNTSIISKITHPVIGGWVSAWNDLNTGFVKPFMSLDSTTRPGITILVSVIITWFLYVPIHELMHVAGCVWTGGTVTELVMGKEYGAALLKNIFPFITPATTQYAGRVTGFEPNGDMGYFITVFAPFFLTLFPGVWILKRFYKNFKFWLLGPGIVIGLASFYNLTGDYFEMGTIVSSRIINVIFGGKPGVQFEGFWLLRSDDIFRLIGEISENPDLYGMGTGLGVTVTILTIVLGAVLAVSLAGWTYELGRFIAKRTGA